MWRPRDRERFIGSYDPEHEMPDPDRRPGDRWESDAYRDTARDSRYAYRMNPNRFEDRFGPRRDVDRDMQSRWQGDARDRDRERERERYSGDRDRYPADRDRGADYRRGYDFGYDTSRYDRDRGGMWNEPWERNRMYGSDRDREPMSRDREPMDRDREPVSHRWSSGGAYGRSDYDRGDRESGYRYGSERDYGDRDERDFGSRWDRDRDRDWRRR